MSHFRVGRLLGGLGPGSIPTFETIEITNPVELSIAALEPPDGVMHVPRSRTARNLACGGLTLEVENLATVSRTSIQLWHVQIEVEDFGPRHRLWPAFSKRLSTHREDGTLWQLAQTVSTRSAFGGIGAIVPADSAGAAIQRTRGFVRRAGRAVDPTETIRWSSTIGRATRYIGE